MAKIPDTMRGLLKSTPSKSYELTSLPVPRPGPGDLLVKVLRASVCGSDIMLYNWTEGKRDIGLFQKRNCSSSYFIDTPCLGSSQNDRNWGNTSI